MEMTLVIVAIAFLTSVLSGVFGMGGGLVLMGALAVILPAAEAIVCHGIIQLVANGWRAYGLRRSIVLAPVGPYLLSSVVTLACLSLASIQANTGLLLILLGSTPFIGVVLECFIVPDPSNKWHSALVGATTSVFQVLAGASGPLLDQLFLHSDLKKEAIIATKAVVQTFGHAMKVGYYGLLLDVLPDSPIIIGCLAIPAAMLGTSFGQVILRKLSESSFRLGSRLLVFMIGFVLIWRGWTTI